MKLWKKLLIGVVILGVIVIGCMGYGIFKVGKVYTEKIAPDMQRYTQMTDAQQDEYVISRLAELYELAAEQEGGGKAAMEAVQRDPELRKAGIAWGRAVCATIIKDDEDIAAKLTSQQKEKYSKEAENVEAKGEHFTQLMDKALAKDKK